MAPENNLTKELKVNTYCMEKNILYNCPYQSQIRKDTKPMSNLPNDPMILLSYINTQLRDNFSSLDELCQSLDVEKSDIEAKLNTIDYSYNPSLNKFV